MLTIDGSMGEGGGQILRTSLALALLTGQSFRIENIRARRDRPGLRPQHLLSVTAAAEVGQAQVHGAAVGSRFLEFRPGTVRSGRFRFAVGTAGATGLVLQTIYLPLALAAGGSELSIEGGTHVPMAPCFHFLATTWCRWLRCLGITVEVEMPQAGFYPKGGGTLKVRVNSCPAILPLHAALRGPLQQITGISAVANLPESIARRQQRQAQKRLEERGLQADIHLQSWPSIGKGTMLGLSAHFDQAEVFVFGLGALGKAAERVADEAVDQLLEYLDAAPNVVDVHSADQLVLPLAFAQGKSEFTVTKVTAHLQTNLEVLRRFLNRSLHCEGNLGAPGRVVID